MFVICTNCNEPILYKEDKEYTENTILVEGSDDEMLIFSLIKDREIIINNITIEAKNRYQSILSRLENIKINSGFINIRKLLLVADANSAGTQARFQEIVRKIDAKIFSLPIKIGLLSKDIPNKKRCGIFLFPDNNSNGTIEDLCLRSLTHPNKVDCIDKHIRCIQNRNLLGTKAKDLSKSKFHIYMSTSEKPTGSIGGATQTGELNLGSQEFDIFVNFLQ